MKNKFPSLIVAAGILALGESVSLAQTNLPPEKFKFDDKTNDGTIVVPVVPVVPIPGSTNLPPLPFVVSNGATGTNGMVIIKLTNKPTVFPGTNGLPFYAETNYGPVYPWHPPSPPKKPWWRRFWDWLF